MKKRVISLLAAAMLLLVCSAPVWADTDKDIQFSGYTFGETFSEAAQQNWINTVEFQHTPKTSRAIADPVYANASWVMYEDSPVGYCFFSRLERTQTVAGHVAGVVLRFYFPTKEAAAAFEVQNAVFYGGEYEFHDQNKKAVFDDLKLKLTTVYGNPSAEFTDPGEFWGEPAHRKSLPEEEAERVYQEDLARYGELSFAVWQQSGTDKQIILVYSIQDEWENTFLYYLDAGADALIEQMYDQGDEGEVTSSDDLQGL